jgi:hypothetical protein
MSKYAYKNVKFKPKSLELIDQCNEIIEDYLGQGLRLTLRQLYYQLVTRNIITNEEKSYKNLSSLVSDARLSGKMDWDAIEDRVRRPRTPGEFQDLRHLVETALLAYRLPRWKGQDYYAELWVEKDALAGVLEPLGSRYHVTLMVNRGYSSQSAMYESANRFIENTDYGRRQPILFYLGDHDPSGEDMVRDIRDRLEMFGVEGLEVRKIALTTPQVQEHNPPPNPAKLTDPRAKDYIEKHGASSWEVDALPPNALADIVKGSFDEILDHDAMEEVKDQEEKDKESLRKAVEELMKEPT